MKTDLVAVIRESGFMDNCSPFQAKEHDDKIKRTLPFYGEYYKQVVDAVRAYNSKPLTWLDVGFGTGKMAETAFGQTELKRFVFNDCSADMLAVVKKRFDHLNTEFIISDVRELEFHSEFDVVTDIQVNQYFHEEGRRAAVRKCFEALRTGGMFIGFENFAPFSEWGNGFLWTGGKPMNGTWGRAGLNVKST